MVMRVFSVCLLLVSGCYASVGSFFVGGFERGMVPSDVYRPKMPLMWTALLKVDRAVMLSYEKQVYHLGRYVEFYAGLGGGFLQTIHDTADNIQTLGCYLATRIYFVKSKAFQMFVIWSPAGPSFLTKKTFATTAFSNRFVFQDQFGFGVAVKGDAEYELFCKLYHFSNGDIFPINGGIDIPLLIGVGIKI